MIKDDHILLAPNMEPCLSTKAPAEAQGGWFMAFVQTVLHMNS